MIIYHYRYALPFAGADGRKDVPKEARRELEATVLEVEGLPLGGIIRPHPALGPLNFYQWVEFVGWHEARHTAQIRENGAVLGTSLEPGGRSDS